MSLLGQKQTWRFESAMSALPPKADIAERNWDVRFVPKADIPGLLFPVLSTMTLRRCKLALPNLKGIHGTSNCLEGTPYHIVE